MLKINSFAVIGGDMRQEYLAKYLYNLDYKINTFATAYDCATEYDDLVNCVKDSDAIILPLPITKDNKTIYSTCDKSIVLINDIFNKQLKNKFVFGGMPTDKIKKFVEDNEIHFYDYFKMEDMTIKNAIATAEGAVSIAIETLPITLYKSHCLVTGYGRIGKALTKILKGFGAKVTVVVRNSSDKVLAEFDNINVIDYNALKLPQHFDVVFNTVPHIVFTKPELKYLNSDAVIIDLASFPGGVDLHQSKSLGIETITASALPSRFSPKSAGEFIAQSVINTIKGDM